MIVRYLLLVLALLFPGLVEAQTPAPLHNGRPAFATQGAETMPMMAVDEAALPLDRFASFPLPVVYWSEMKACAAMAGYDVSAAGEAPTVIVIPAARTIRVHDITLDSLLYAEDSTFMGEKWSDPTVGYALVRSNIVLVTEPYRANKYVLRHEALHFILWRSRHWLAHPADLFIPCDKAYE